MFVHISALERSGLAGLSEGDRVIVDISEGRKGPEAARVRFAWIAAVSVQWSGRIGKLLDRDCDPMPDSRPCVITVYSKLRGTSKAAQLRLISVAIDHQHCDTPDVDFLYHAGTITGLVFQIA